MNSEFAKIFQINSFWKWTEVDRMFFRAKTVFFSWSFVPLRAIRVKEVVSPEIAFDHIKWFSRNRTLGPYVKVNPPTSVMTFFCHFVWREALKSLNQNYKNEPPQWFFNFYLTTFTKNRTSFSFEFTP